MGLFRSGIVALVFALLPAVGALGQPALIPMPASTTWHDGAFQMTAATVVQGGGAAAPTAAYLSRALGLRHARGGASRIRLLLVSDKAVPGEEAYRLRVTGKEVRIEASDSRGLFYGAQTLRQLVEATPSGSREIPAVDIRDAPRFRWRGLLIDVSRHFFGKPTLLRMIDEMAAYKLNVLHLHLTDDPGWRLEIPGYPKLTGVGALGDATGENSGVRQFFSAEDIREIVAYAAERHIMVVPEIEMPGHAGAAARAYPELFDGGTFNPGKPQAYDFIRAVLTEVSRLFPAPYIHFGGDEVPDTSWKDAADVTRLKAEQGFNTTKQVQAYFGAKVVDIVRDLGKRPMAWDEQAEAGADKHVVIQWWRKDRPDVLNAAAKAGYDLVMSPVDQVYFDYPQGPGEPGAPWEGNDNGPTSIAKILAWEPVPASFTPDESAKVLGVEAAVWTEFIRSERYLQFMTFPRLLAFAEVAWRPRGARDAKEFASRLQPHTDALRQKGINARRESGDAFEFIVN
jgi:hexosaminidase